MVLFANPYDFESGSAIYQAVELSARSGTPCTVCLVGPADATEKWFDTPLVWTAAQNGLKLYRDAGGVEAKRFAVKNSGVCLAFDARGKLCFYGDLTKKPTDKERDEGVKAALDALSHIRGQQERLILRPVDGKPLN